MDKTKEQMQEEEYSFPYHYLNLLSPFQDVEYVSYLKLVKRLIKFDNKPIILDFGCGDGRFEYELGNSNYHITGIDFSERALAFARAFNKKAEFHSVDVLKFRPKNKFDYVVSIETFEHLPPNSIRQIARALASLLKKDGKLIITVPSKNMPTAEKHYQHFDEKLLSSYLDENFILERAFGQHRMGFINFAFRIINSIGRFLEILSKDSILTRKYARLTWNFYRNNLEIGPLNKTKRLIAIYSLKK